MAWWLLGWVRPSRVGQSGPLPFWALPLSQESAVSSSGGGSVDCQSGAAESSEVGLRTWTLFTNTDEKALLGTQGKAYSVILFETSVSSSRLSGLNGVVLHTLPPASGVFVSSRDILDCHDLGRSYWHPVLRDQVTGNTHHRELRSSNVHGAMAEDPCLNPGPCRSPVPHTAPESSEPATCHLRMQRALLNVPVTWWLPSPTLLFAYLHF